MRPPARQRVTLAKTNTTDHLRARHANLNPHNNNNNNKNSDADDQNPIFSNEIYTASVSESAQITVGVKRRARWP